MIAVCLSVPTVRAQEAAPFFLFDIPQGSASTTIPRVALTADVEILFEASTVGTLTTRALNGEYTALGALQTMLEGNPMRGRPG